MSTYETGGNESGGEPWHDKETLEQLYHGKSLTQKEVADELGCSTNTICSWMDRLDVEVSDTGGPWRDKGELERLYIDQENTIREVAEELDCSPHTVQVWLDKFDIETREIGGGSRDDCPPKEKLIEWYHGEGLSTHEIADKTGYSSRGIVDIMEGHGVERRDRIESVKKTRPDKTTLENLYWGEEKSIRDLAGEFGCGYTLILQVMREYGIERRPNDEHFNQSGEDHPAWSGGHERINYGPNWDGKRQKVLERDGYECRSCGMPIDDHVEEYGCGLDIHHIVPLREFDDRHEANRVDNLVAACKECHRRFEGMPVFPIND